MARIFVSCLDYCLFLHLNEKGMSFALKKHTFFSALDFKGFHGSTGPSGRAVKALFLCEDFARNAAQGGNLPLTILSQRKS